MSSSPPKKPKTGPAVQSQTMLNFFRPKPSAKAMTAAVSEPRPTSDGSSRTGLEEKKEREVISLDDDTASVPIVKPSKSSAMSDTSLPSPYSSASSSSSWDSLPSAKPVAAPPSRPTATDASSRETKSTRPSTTEASEPVRPSPYASASTSSSWDSLPKVSKAPSSSSFSSVKPSYPKVVPSYAPVSSGGGSSSSSSSSSGTPNRYQAEIAKSGRSICRDFKCKQKIEKGELRIGKVTPNYFHEGSDDVMTQWFHPPCIFSALSRAKGSTKRIDRVEDIENFEGLSEMHQNWIRELLVQTAGMSSKPPSAVKAKSGGSGGSGGGSSSMSGSGASSYSGRFSLRHD